MIIVVREFVCHKPLWNTLLMLSPMVINILRSWFFVCFPIMWDSCNHELVFVIVYSSQAFWPRTRFCLLIKSHVLLYRPPYCVLRKPNMEVPFWICSGRFQVLHNILLAWCLLLSFCIPSDSTRVGLETASYVMDSGSTKSASPVTSEISQIHHMVFFFRKDLC
jgi:hypothetical protein